MNFHLVSNSLYETKINSTKICLTNNSCSFYLIEQICEYTLKRINGFDQQKYIKLKLSYIYKIFKFRIRKWTVMAFQTVECCLRELEPYSTVNLSTDGQPQHTGEGIGFNSVWEEINFIELSRKQASRWNKLFKKQKEIKKIKQ